METYLGQRIEVNTSTQAEASTDVRITPQLLQYLKVLQMNAASFETYIKEAIIENPMLEPADLHRVSDPEASSGSFSNTYSSSYSGSNARMQTDSRPEPVSIEAAYDETLEFELKSQLEGINKRSRLPDPVYRLCLVLIENIDSDGYLAHELIEHLSSLKGIGEEKVLRALAIIQSMSPAGIGARDDEECIRIQQERGSRINPAPGTSYQTKDQVRYIYPDIYITRVEGSQEHGQEIIEPYDELANITGADAGNEIELKVTIDSRHEPVLQLSNQYLKLLEETDDPETRSYLKAKKAQAEWLFDCIRRRYETLISIATVIADLQRDFLTDESKAIRPVTLADVAEAAGVHPSTVSRAIRDKYISTDRGMYPMAFFLPRTRSSEAGTMSYSDTQKKLIRKLIYSEDRSRPLSDQKIAEMLKSQGYIISRRAVAKYRQEMRIPSTIERRV